MIPRTPFIQRFEQLPDELPIYTLANALLAGGELPLELSSPTDLALFFEALRHHQLVGLRQPKRDTQADAGYQIGCAGRIRQYRERSDGKLNVMLTGVCRFKILEEVKQSSGFIKAKVDFNDYVNDYLQETVEPGIIDDFKSELRQYFERNHQQVDWTVLDQQPVEKLINNLVLVVDLSVEDKQVLLEAPALKDRTLLFTDILINKVHPQNSPIIN